MLNSVLYFVVFLFVLNTQSNAQNGWRVSSITNIDKIKLDFTEITMGKTVVFVFYSIDCPLCKKYTKTIRDLSSDQEGIDFYLVFCGKQNGKKIKKFKSTYEMHNEVILDPDYELADALQATITPEAFLLKSTLVIYSGAIDDWVIKLGSTKSEVQQHYLKDAIATLKEGKIQDFEKTKAIGCFIR